MGRPLPPPATDLLSPVPPYMVLRRRLEPAAAVPRRAPRMRAAGGTLESGPPAVPAWAWLGLAVQSHVTRGESHVTSWAR